MQERYALMQGERVIDYHLEKADQFAEKLRKNMKKERGLLVKELVLVS